MESLQYTLVAVMFDFQTDFKSSFHIQTVFSDFYHGEVVSEDYLLFVYVFISIPVPQLKQISVLVDLVKTVED